MTYASHLADRVITGCGSSGRTWVAVELSLTGSPLWIVHQLVTPVVDMMKGIARCSPALQGGPKKRYPNFIFAITSVNVHRF